ncbi:MAG: T9SS type A sorting domain-containing protein, partial [Bacteroidales bacterium]
VYPNPASDWVNLEFSASGQEDIIITILDTYGRTILSKEIRSVNGFVNERLDLSELDNGLYFVRIGNENEVLKLIKK